MKNIPVTVLSLGIVTIIYFSCGTTVSTGGGTGTETVNTYAMRPDGMPAAGAEAKIIEARFWIDSIQNGASPILRKAIADDNGRIELCFPEHDATVNLQIDHEDGALLLPLPVSVRDHLDTVRLQSHASFSGTFDDSSAPPSRVLLAGTSYQSSVNESGAFIFKEVAPGSYAVLSVNDALPAPAVADGIALTLKEGAVLQQQMLPVDSSRLLIDNFESGIGPTSLGRIIPVFGWYVLSDSLYYYWHVEKAEWTKGVSSVIGHSPICYDSTADGTGGRALSFSTVLDPLSSRANALIGITFKPLSNSGIDLSSMSAFSLRASGKGTIRVRFESTGLDSASSLLSHYAYPIRLSNVMQQYTVPVDSLRILEPVSYASRYPWKTESKNILRIEFEFSPNANDRGDSLSCTLDDFYLEGISITSLLEGTEKYKDD
ncbi:MAG: hypothetical protein JXA18_09920 [Chitinispirillaceae bacterium]|nr:hypothetical protein [Chitinispirillaceae bacterium]